MKFILRLMTLLVLLVILSSCNKECDAQSDPLTPECVVKCKQVPEAGSCEALFTKYYFYTKTKKCETFIWGGCNGVVPFDTMEECLACGCK